jgi:hypothetical protein
MLARLVSFMYFCSRNIHFEQKYKCMIKKNFRRCVFLIKISKNDKVLGYYAGKDDNCRIVAKGLNDAMIFKTAKGIQHNITNLEKKQGKEYSFKLVVAEETKTTIFYDAYDKVKCIKPLYAIGVKDKSDMLSEAKYVSEVDFKNETFTTTFAIEKALLAGERQSWKTYRFLSKRFHEKYEFYQELIYVKRERTIETRD